jgi:hypothetical protein
LVQFSREIVDPSEAALSPPTNPSALPDGELEEAAREAIGELPSQ